MTMQGSLKDIGIAELIQFPAQSRKTGRIVIERDGQRVELWYQSGELHHATLGDRSGFPVLVEILPWTRGTFEFEVDVLPPSRSIEMDLGKALLNAMMQGDPKPDESATSPQNVQSTVGFGSFFGPKWDSATYARISTFLADHPLFFYACVLLRKGTVKAEFFRPIEDLEESVQTYMLLKDIMKQYAFTCQGRMIVDSSYCLVAIGPVGEDQVVITLSRPGARQEDVEIAIDGLVVKLEDPFAL
jgi:hypothetical protein